jgi:hypothetical protein
MDIPKEHHRALEGAAAALSRTMGTDVRLVDAVSLANDERRNLILRARAVQPDGMASSVIVKATRATGYNPADPDAFETSGLVKEWAATSYLTRSSRGHRHSPRFLAGDAALGLIVFEDLGADLGSLVRPLLEGTAAEARTALVAYATSLGRLHADTLGCAVAHASILTAAFPMVKAMPPFGGERWRRDVVGKVRGLLGGDLPDDEVATVARRMAEPGPWLGLVHRDPCPDNVLLVDGEARLLDYEFARPGHVLLDAAYWRMGFPTCWCAGRVPDRTIAQMDRAYRDALGAALPLALDDEVYAAETAVFLFVRMFASHSWLLEDVLKEDTRWGIASRRGRLLWHLQAAIDGAERAGTFHGLRELATRWQADLAGRWPGCQPLGLYPSFAKSQGRG